MNKLIITIAAVFLSTTAWAQCTSTTEKTGVNSVLGMAPSTQDFVAEAATSDIFEIESSKLALERSDAATKAFAQQMITDHEKTTADLKGLVGSGKVKANLPSAMTDNQQSALNDLKALQEDDFNKQYHSIQVDAHESRSIPSSDTGQGRTGGSQIMGRRDAAASAAPSRQSQCTEQIGGPRWNAWRLGNRVRRELS